MKKLFGRVCRFIKKNIFSSACLLLATLVLVTGSISYSKYLSGGNGGGLSGIGSFSVSAKIDGVSALSFTNTAFWGGSVGGDRIAMNALRSLKFSVNNYETDGEGNKKIADVRSRYTLSFSAPVVFAEKLAIQVFSETDQAIMPQIVLSDLKSAADSGKSHYDTSTSDDFNGADFSDLQFALSSGADYYVATADGLTVTLEKYTKNVEQSLLFRMWDTSDITSETEPTVSAETGKLQPPLTVTFKQDVEFYRIGIRSNDFVLPAGVETTVSYTVRLAPTDSIVDEHLGGIFVDKTIDSSGNVTSSPVSSIYASNQACTVQTTRESYTDSYYGDSTFSGAVIKTETDDYNVMGSPKKYTQGETLQSIETSSENVDLSADEESVVMSYSDSESVTWDSFAIDNSVVEPTLDNYTDKCIDIAVRSKDEHNYGTHFYIYKLKAIGTGTRKVTQTATAMKILSGHTATKAQKVTESTYVKQSDESQENITLEITRTTETTSYGEYLVETTVTTTTYTEKIKQEGYIYRGYYCASDGVLRYWADANKSDIDTALNSTESGISYTVETFNPNSEAKAEVLSKLDETISVAQLPESNESFIKSVQKEYIERVLHRQYNYSDITLTEVSMPETDAAGNAVLENGVTKIKYYTADSPLELFQSQNGVMVQKYYLSQCYSKTYPFFVNTIFEQIL